MAGGGAQSPALCQTLTLARSQALGSDCLVLKNVISANIVLWKKI
jgi:hypothetical protein